MSDIEKAEELLKTFLSYTKPISLVSPGAIRTLHEEVQEYFRKPAHITDGFGRSVQVFIDSNEDLVMEWQDAEYPPVLFNAYMLVGALKEIGVI